jgi:hypothetical protein
VGRALAALADGDQVACTAPQCGRMFQTQDLLAAAQHLHRAIRVAVDPEAFSDFHGEHPFIELRDPATIVKPWRPGSGIVARQAAAMANIGAGLSRPRDTK